MGTEVKQQLQNLHINGISLQPPKNGLVGKPEDDLVGPPELDGRLDGSSLFGLDTLIQFDLQQLMPAITLVRIPSKAPKNSKVNPLIVVHPIEGTVTCLAPLAKQVEFPVWGLQCTQDADLRSTEDLAAFYIKEIRKYKKSGPFNVAGYSYGTGVVFEMALQLQKAGDEVNLILFDGSPEFIKDVFSRFTVRHNDSNCKAAEETDSLTFFICMFRRLDSRKVRRDLLPLKDLDARLARVAELLRGHTPCPENELVATARNIYFQLVTMHHYWPSEKFRGPVTLFRSEDHFTEHSDDYGLSEICTRTPKIYTLKGNHRQILVGESSQRIAKVLNETLNKV